jgi:hypothetical protein
MDGRRELADSDDHEVKGWVMRTVGCINSWLCRESQSNFAPNLKPHR